MSMRCILSSVTCPALQYFSTLYHKRHDFRKKLLNTINVFWFYRQRFSETFLIIRRNEPDMVQVHIRVHVNFPLFLSIKLELFREIFEKYLNIEFYEYLSSGSLVVPCGQTDRHHEAHSRSSQFCENA